MGRHGGNKATPKNPKAAVKSRLQPYFDSSRLLQPPLVGTTMLPMNGTRKLWPIVALTSCLAGGLAGADVSPISVSSVSQKGSRLKTMNWCQWEVGWTVGTYLSTQQSVTVLKNQVDGPGIGRTPSRVGGVMPGGAEFL